MPELILTLNSGSSSLKLAVFDTASTSPRLLLEGSATGIGHDAGALHLLSAQGDSLLSRDHILESQAEAFGSLIGAIKDKLPSAPKAIGHRIVHGGPKLREHQQLTPEVINNLKAAVPFAPLHLPSALQLIAKSGDLFPDIPQFACFDTAFHRTLPHAAAQLPISARYFDTGVQRYGFHGLSYESLVRRLGASLPARAVFAHLGSGASLAAVCEGRSIDTTMAFTPDSGIPMGTRSGDLDPGVLLYMLREEHLRPDQIEGLLNKQSGLAAFSNGESDMQALLTREATGDAAAKLAIDAFCIAVRKQIGAYAALLGGLDLVVFTGGIGEHSQAIRERTLEGLHFLGLEPAGERVRVMPTEEELQIAIIVRALLAPAHD